MHGNQKQLRISNRPKEESMNAFFIIHDDGSVLKRVPYGQTRCLSFEFPLPDDQAPASDLSNQAPTTSACEQRWRSASLSVESGGWFGLYAKSPLT